MRAYIIRRLLMVIPTVLLATSVVFILIRLVPGDIIDLMVAEMGPMTAISRAEIEKSLGMDVPVHVQYGRWVGVVPLADGNFSGLLQGSLGISLWKDTPVTDDILTRWPITLQLGLMGLTIALLIALPIGMYSALRQDTWGDYVARSFATALIAVPGFWVGTMAIVFPAIWWGYMPPIRFAAFTADPIGNLRMFTLPAIILGMALSGTTMRLTRTMMLEVLRQDYIRTAWAKGLIERSVVIRHALKNTLIPVITLLGLYMAVVIGGTVIIEEIFGLPGMGRLLINAIRYRDYPVISGVLVAFSIAMVLINLMVDLTYAFLDPRIRYE